MTPTRSEDATAIERAAAWLRAYMVRRGGQAGAGAVLIAAVAAGHAPRTVRRAAHTIGLAMPRRGQGTVWTLAVQPERGQSAARAMDRSGHAAPADAAPATDPDGEPPATRQVLAVDGPVRVASAQAASQWDERAWRSGGPL